MLATVVAVYRPGRDPEGHPNITRTVSRWLASRCEQGDAGGEPATGQSTEPDRAGNAPNRTTTETAATTQTNQNDPATDSEIDRPIPATVIFSTVLVMVSATTTLLWVADT